MYSRCHFDQKSCLLLLYFDYFASLLSRWWFPLEIDSIYPVCRLMSSLCFLFVRRTKRRHHHLDLLWCPSLDSSLSPLFLSSIEVIDDPMLLSSSLGNHCPWMDQNDSCFLFLCSLFFVKSILGLTINYFFEERNDKIFCEMLDLISLY